MVQEVHVVRLAVVLEDLLALRPRARRARDGRAQRAVVVGAVHAARREVLAVDEVEQRHEVALAVPPAGKSTHRERERER